MVVVAEEACANLGIMNMVIYDVPNTPYTYRDGEI